MTSLGTIRDAAKGDLNISPNEPRNSQATEAPKRSDTPEVTP